MVSRAIRAKPRGKCLFWAKVTQIFIRLGNLEKKIHMAEDNTVP